MWGINMRVYCKYVHNVSVSVSVSVSIRTRGCKMVEKMHYVMVCQVSTVVKKKREENLWCCWL